MISANLTLSPVFNCFVKFYKDFFLPRPFPFSSLHFPNYCPLLSDLLPILVNLPISGHIFRDLWGEVEAYRGLVEPYRVTF